MYTLRLLGGVSLEGPSGPVSGRAVQRRQLALASMLAAARGKGCTRDKLQAYLFSDSDQEHARHLLSDAVYVLRKDLGEQCIHTSGDVLRLNPGAIKTDVGAFEEALERGDLETAVACYAGPFLDGFHLGGSGEFDDWVEWERQHCAIQYEGALEALAERAESSREYIAAVASWRRLAAHDPYNTRFAIRLMRSLAATGDRANALKHAQEHEQLLRRELDIEPDAELRALVEQLRQEAAVTDRAAVELPPRVEPAGREGAALEAETLATPRRKAAAVPVSHSADRRVRVGIAVVSLAAVIGASWILFQGKSGSRRAASGIAGHQRGIAVLPFHIVGSGFDEWREGMVDFLSMNLDGVAGLQRVDPRVVIRGWRTALGDSVEALDVRTALSVAREAGARYALMGTLASSGSRVRLGADLYDTSSGDRLSAAQSDGAPDSIISVLDRLTVDLLRAGLGAELAEAPSLEFGRATTSIPALAAYLEGEQKFRRSKFREAIPDFTRAVEADSTFGLAWYRLWLAYDWIAQPRGELYEQALRYRDRLPTREALILRAIDAPLPDNIHAMEDLADRYPGDAEIRYWLADEYFHDGERSLHPRSKAMGVFRHAIELDPGFSPAYIHLIDGAFRSEDRGGAQELIKRYRELDPDSHAGIGCELGFDLVWGDGAARRAAAAALDTASAVVLVRTFVTLGWVPAFHAQLLQVSNALLAERQPPYARVVGERGLVLSRLHQGRVREALSGFPTEQRSQADLFFVNYIAWSRLGYVDSDAARRAAMLVASEPTPRHRFWAGVLAAQEGRWDDLAEQSRALEVDLRDAQTQQDSARRAEIWTLAEVLRGFAAGNRGDLAAAIEHLERAQWSAEAAYADIDIATLWRLELGRLLFETGAFREAEKYFRSIEWSWGAYLATLVAFHLGQVYEALGDAESAERYFRRLTRWWQNPDPELRPHLEYAERAVQRLSG